MPVFIHRQHKCTKKIKKRMLLSIFVAKYHNVFIYGKQFSPWKYCVTLPDTCKMDFTSPAQKRQDKLHWYKLIYNIYIKGNHI